MLCEYYRYSQSHSRTKLTNHETDLIAAKYFKEMGRKKMSDFSRRITHAITKIRSAIVLLSIKPVGKQTCIKSHPSNNIDPPIMHIYMQYDDNPFLLFSSFFIDMI